MDKENMKHRRLQELDRSDFEIVDGEPDIRGWDVKLSSGQKVGDVEDLIIDAKRKKVRYMIVDLDDNDFDFKQDKVLIPIGLAQLDKDNDDVMLPNVQVEQLRHLPEYQEDTLDEVMEKRISNTFGRKTDATGSTESIEMDSDFYQHEYFNDDNLYKNRLHQSSSSQQESEYERGLRLWEKRSEGGIIPENRSYQERDIPDEARMEMVRNRRNAYQQRRYGNSSDRGYNRPYRRDNSVEGRIRDEGLQDG